MNRSGPWRSFRRSTRPRTIQQVIDGLHGNVDHILVVDDGSTDATASLARRAGADVLEHGTIRGKGHAIRSAIEWVIAGDFTHALTLDGDMQHLPGEAPLLLAAARDRSGYGAWRAPVRREAMPASRYHANRLGKPRAVVVRRQSLLGHAMRVPGCPRRGASRNRAPGARLRHRDRDAREALAPPARASPPCRSPPSTPASEASCGRCATRPAPASWLSTIATSNASDRGPPPLDASRAQQRGHLQRDYHGVRTLPRAVSYAIGHAGTWLAWRCMTSTRRAIADNLSPLFPRRTPPNWSGAPWTPSEAMPAT